MYAVVNHLHLDIPVTELAPKVKGELLSLLEGCPGFDGFYFTQEDEKRGTAIILWDTAVDAANGANVV